MGYELLWAYQRVVSAASRMGDVLDRGAVGLVE